MRSMIRLPLASALLIFAFSSVGAAETWHVTEGWTTATDVSIPKAVLSSELLHASCETLEESSRTPVRYILKLSNFQDVLSNLRDQKLTTMTTPITEVGSEVSSCDAGLENLDARTWTLNQKFYRDVRSTDDHCTEYVEETIELRTNNGVIAFVGLNEKDGPVDAAVCTKYPVSARSPL